MGRRSREGLMLRDGMEETMNGIPDSEVRKSESSCLTRQSEGVRMEGRGSEME